MDPLFQRLIESLERDRERALRIEIPVRMRIDHALGTAVWALVVGIWWAQSKLTGQSQFVFRGVGR